MHFLWVLAWVLIAASTARATDWKVEPGENMLQDIVDHSAASGDTLTLLDGVFFENLVITSGDWTIRAEHSGAAILDGSRADSSVIYIEGGGHLTLEGLVVQNGRGSHLFFSETEKYGGGLCVFRSWFTVRSCAFRNNRLEGDTEWSGGAIHAEIIGVGEVTDCLFEDNFATGLGTAISSTANFMTLRNSIFRNNGTSENWVLHLGQSNVRVEGCQVTGPGHALFYGTDVVISQNRFDDVVVGLGEPWKSGPGSVAFRDNLLIGSTTSPGGFGVFSGGTQFECTGNTFAHQELEILDYNWGGLSFSNNVFFESSGVISSPSGNGSVSCVVAWPKVFEDSYGTLGLEESVVVANPEFCDSTEWNLRTTSPCLSGNSPKECQDLIGARGSCGENPVLMRSWGGIKKNWAKKKGGRAR